jgi:hypothetical protein
LYFVHFDGTVHKRIIQLILEEYTPNYVEKFFLENKIVEVGIFIFNYLHSCSWLI